MSISTRTLRACLAAITALFAVLVFASPATAATFPQFAPNGTHLQAGSIGCTETATGVNCTAFELAGVGNTNAVVALRADYTATIQCTNKGGSLVESHDHGTSTFTSTNVPSTKNGRLVVPAQTSTAPTEAQVLADADCPNPNWTPSVLAGSVTLTGFTYTLTFAGFSSPYIVITG